MFGPRGFVTFQSVFASQSWEQAVSQRQRSQRVETVPGSDARAPHPPGMVPSRENKGGLFQRRKSWTSANSAVHLALGLPATWASGSQEELQQVALSSCRMRSPCPTTAGRTSPSHPVLARFFPEGDDDKNHLHRTSDRPLAKRLHTRRCAFTLGRISSGQKENETLCS